MEITKKADGAKLEVNVQGRVNTQTAPELEAALGDLSGVENLVLDLAGLEYLSSAGLRVLLSSQKAMMAKGGSMVLHNVNDEVMEVFKITGFVDILTIE